MPLRPVSWKRTASSPSRKSATPLQNRRIRRRTRRLFLEPLEDRRVLTFYAVDDFVSTTVDVPVGIGMLGNDVNDTNEYWWVDSVSTPSNGSLALTNTDYYLYTPNSGFIGADSFSYTVIKVDGDSYAYSSATVNIEVTEPPPPTIVDDFYSIDPGVTLTVAAPGVLANDYDPTGYPLSAWLISGNYSGSLSFSSDGSFTYYPSAGFSGVESFTYANSANPSLTATVTISTAVPPVANDDAYTTPFGVTLEVSASGVLGNDSGSPLSAILASPPASGSLALQADGSFSYTPESSFRGTVSFTYSASNGLLSSDPAVVTINANAAPLAASDSLSTAEDTPLTVSAPGILGNDSDADGDELIAYFASGPEHGVLTLNTDGSFTYTPYTDYYGGDQFTYRASDGLAFSEVATVAVWMTLVNDAPLASEEAYATPQDTPLTIAAPGVLANDADADWDALTAAVVAGVAHGTLTLNSNGSFTYTPNTGYYGTDSFTYEASDGELTSNIATVTLTVPQAIAPVANPNSYQTDVNTPLTIAAPGVLANDYDANGDPLTAVLVGGAANGSLSLNASGSFTYTPDTGFIGLDSFTYKASDGQHLSDPAMVTIAVGPDVEIGLFKSNGTDLQVNYRVWGTLTQAFQIAIYASDGGTPGQELQSVAATEISAGWHSIYLPPTFADLDSDYYLMAQVDSGDAITEASEDNNTCAFTGDAFVATEAGGKKVLHVQGRDAADSLGTSQAGGILTLSNSLLYEYQYTAANIDEIHLRGHAGNDVLAIDAAFTKPTWLFGGAGDDTLTGGIADDQLFGGDGADSLTARAGNDQLAGGAADDFLSGDAGNDNLFGEEGKDVQNGGAGNDILLGGDGDDTLNGDAGDDNLAGEDGTDTVTGGEGDDTLNDDSGIDQLDGGPGYNDAVDSVSYVRIVPDFSRILDVIFDDRGVTITLTGPDGLFMSTFVNLGATGSYTSGGVDSTFPLYDPDTVYTVTVTPSSGLVGGDSVTFNSSELQYDASGVFEFPPVEILSTGVNTDENGNPPPGYEPPNPPPPYLQPQNDFGPVPGTNGYQVLQGGTIEITDPAEGVLPNDHDGDDSPYSAFTAQLVVPPEHGSLTLNSDGTFAIAQDFRTPAGAR